MIDDEKTIVDVMREMLEPEGFSVVGYTDPATALEDLEKGAKSDAVLTDIGMPGMDGYELYSRLKKKRPGLPVVFMTGFGYDLRHCIVRARMKGLTHCLYKPFKAQKLIDTLNEVTLANKAGNSSGKDLK